MNLTARQLAAVVLAKAALVDSRTPKPDPHVLDAWAEILANCPPCTLGDAAAIVTEHYGVTNDRLMPADVVRLVKARIRVAPAPAAPRALPSRFETDDERNDRLRAGVEQCRAVVRRPPATPDGVRQVAQPELLQELGQPVFVCDLCNAGYLDDDKGQAAHRVVFGHNPATTVEGTA